LPPTRFNELLNALEVRSYRNRDIIVREDNTGDTYYIIKSGKVDVYKGEDKIRSASKDDYFAENPTVFND
jgi:signal-transduction protein with cAMP-binding, CBS, and nucleotidyltransferase domain